MNDGGLSFNIYIPSYRRSDSINTHNLLEYCTYVVRETEASKYVDAGVNVLSVDDTLIDSIPKVQNWIIENTDEDVVCIADDDIHSFVYRNDTNSKIADSEISTSEIERIAQLVVDLDIGYMSVPNDMSPMYYDRPFKFCGITGQLRIINKAKCVARFNDIDFLNDIDFELQELLLNRIILIPCYFLTDADVDTNSGGSNDSKTMTKYTLANIEMKQKWGKYYIPSQNGKPGRISVKR